MMGYKRYIRWQRGQPGIDKPNAGMGFLKRWRLFARPKKLAYRERFCKAFS